MGTQLLHLPPIVVASGASQPTPTASDEGRTMFDYNNRMWYLCLSGSWVRAPGIAAVEGNLDYLGDEQLTGLTTSKALASIPTGARVVLLQAETQVIRMRTSTNAPTASVGFRILTTSQGLLYTGSDLSILRFIEETATAKLNAIYFR